jgi:hypothetical protein
MTLEYKLAIGPTLGYQHDLDLPYAVILCNGLRNTTELVARFHSRSYANEFIRVMNESVGKGFMHWLQSNLSTGWTDKAKQ